MVAVLTYKEQGSTFKFRRFFNSLPHFFQRTSGYSAMEQLAEAPRDPPITAEKAGTVNLYRSKQTVSCIDYLNLTISLTN